MNSDKNRPAAARLTFSLRTLLALVLIVGSFLCGWVANEARHRYVIKDDAKIEFTDVGVAPTIVVRGVKEDVQALAETLSKSMESAVSEDD